MWKQVCLWLMLGVAAAACVDLDHPRVTIGLPDASSEGGGGPPDLDPGEAGPGEAGPPDVPLSEDSPPDTGTGGSMGAGGAPGTGGTGTGGTGTGGSPGTGGAGDASPPVDTPKPLKANGQACGAASECTSGACTDGVCCASACSGLCEACDLPGLAGTCAPVTAGSDPAGECALEVATSCRQDGFCNGARACRLHTAGTSCGPASCTGGSETTARTCDGLGTCQAAMMRACAPNLCGASACNTSCTSPAACAPGAACIGASCVAANGLQIYWSFDEASGTQALDFSGQGRNGTYEGAGSSTPLPTTMAPTLQYANPRSRTFSTAAKTEARLKNIPAVLMPSNNLTVSLWFRATAVTDPSGMGEMLSIADGIAVYLQNNVVAFSKRTGNNVYSRAVHNTTGHLDGNWHHVAGVASATAGMTIYFDGQLRSSTASVTSVAYNTVLDFLIGADMDPTWGAYFGGDLDEVRVYNRALSASEVAALAAGGR